MPPSTPSNLIPQSHPQICSKPSTMASPSFCPHLQQTVQIFSNVPSRIHPFIPCNLQARPHQPEKQIRVTADLSSPFPLLQIQSPGLINSSVGIHLFGLSSLSHSFVLLPLISLTPWSSFLSLCLLSSPLSLLLSLSLFHLLSFPLPLYNKALKP